MRRRVWRVLGISVTVLVLAAVLPAAIVLNGSDYPVTWLRTIVEERIEQLLGENRIALGAVSVALDPVAVNPELVIDSAVVLDREGNVFAELGETRIGFRLQSILVGNARITRIEVDEARIRFGTGDGSEEQPRTDANADNPINTEPNADNPIITESNADNPNDTEPNGTNAIANVFKALDGGALNALKKIAVGRTVFQYNQAGSGREFVLGDSSVRIDRSEDGVDGAVVLAVGRAEENLGTATMGFEWSKETLQTEVSLNVSDLNSTSIANMFGIAVEPQDESAPISADFELSLNPGGSLDSVDGAINFGSLLNIGEFANIRQMSITAAFDQETGKLEIENVGIESNAIAMKMDGYLYLSESSTPIPSGVEGQLRFSEAVLSPPGIFERQVTDLSGGVDFRLRFAPLSLEVARFNLNESAVKFVATGNFSLAQNGVSIALDFSSDILPRDRFIGLWPVTFIAPTRTWLAKNFKTGVFKNLQGAYRSLPGETPELMLTFQFDQVAFQYIPTLPPVSESSGFGTLTLNELDILFETGIVSVPDSGVIDLSGSRFQIPDLKRFPAPARVLLDLDGGIYPIFTLLDYPPFEFIQKSGIPKNLATGKASGTASLEFPIIRKLGTDDLTIVVDGKFTEVVSSELLGGNSLTANTLDVNVTNNGMTISGEGALGSTAVSGEWRREFGNGVGNGSAINGTLELSRRFLDELNVPLPDYALLGSNSSNFSIIFAEDPSPQFLLTSDLRGLHLEFPFLNWRKSENEVGELMIAGRISSPIELSRVEFSANSLDASGNIRLGEDGSVVLAQFDRFRKGDSFNTAVALRTDNSGIGMEIAGGTIDLRQIGSMVPAGNSSFKGPINVRLDNLILTSKIAMTEVSGTVRFDGAQRGGFSGRLNGGQWVDCTIISGEFGSGIKISSVDAGAAIRSAGILNNLHDGQLELFLLPSETRGLFNGKMQITDFRAKDVPALGELLSLISVVGLVEKLGGDGIHFSDIEIWFDLSESEMVIKRAIARGASLGATMAGFFDLRNSSMDLAGVITPVYFLNDFLEKVTPVPMLLGIKEGEGFGSMNYSVAGPFQNPVVSVNPVSAITPGFFRNLFPQRKPKSTQ